MTTTNEFESWLQKGLGRVVLHLKRHDSQPYRKSLLHGCLHNLAYDPQCEGTREGYLYEAICATADERYYRDGVFKALTSINASDQWDLYQVMALARKFAERGDGELIAAMYDAVKLTDPEISRDLYDNLVAVDGVNALVFASEHLPSNMADEEPWVVESLVDEIRRRDGDVQANESIEAASRAYPKLNEFLSRAKQARSNFDSGRSENPHLSYAEIRSAIQEDRREPNLFIWGKNASDEDLEAAADDLIRETDRDRIIKYLRIFRWRPFPRPIDRLLQLAESSDDRIPWQAVQRLAMIKDARIRELALSYMNTPSRVNEGIELLISNYEDGDFRAIEGVIRQASEQDEIHSIGMSVRGVIENKCPPEAVESLLLLYEKGPCALCRTHFVRNLIELGAIPEWMREECRFDADPDTRKLVS